MYYVNQQQIHIRLAVVDQLVELFAALPADSRSWNVIEQRAAERGIHLAIEIVTDVGSYLIDGFIMRDASSYEDIVTIIAGEQVIESSLATLLSELVRERKPLVQHYFYWTTEQSLRLIGALPQAMLEFRNQVMVYLQAELGA